MDGKNLSRLCEIGEICYQRAWVYATAGNFSIRSQNKNSFWITASGLSKGNLKKKDFLLCEVGSAKILQKAKYQKPSAETSIHNSIYHNLEFANAILHVHTVAGASLDFGASREHPIVFAKLPNLEMVKAFGIWEEEPNVQMAVVHNFTEVEKIAEHIDSLLKPKSYSLPFVMVQHHGPTVWGKDLEEALKHLEALEFLFQSLVQTKGNR